MTSRIWTSLQHAPQRFIRLPWKTQAILVLLSAVLALGGSAVVATVEGGSFALVIAIAVFIGLWIAVRPEIGVYVLTAFIYLNLSDILEVQFGIPSINKLLVGMVFVSTIANRLVLYNKPFLFRRSEWFIVNYIVVLVMSTFVALDRNRAFNGVIDTVKDFLIIVIIVQICEEEHVWINIQWSILFSATLVAALSCYQMLTGDFSNDFFGLANAPTFQIVQTFDSARVTGPLSDPNYYAQILLIALPFGIYRAWTDRRRLNQIIGLITSLIITLAIVFTYSRGGFLALLAVAVMVIRAMRINIFKVFVVLFLLFVFVLPALPVGYTERLQTLTSIFQPDPTMQAEESFRGRSSELLIALRMFSDYPVLGVGYLNYENNYQDYNQVLGLDSRTEEREAHTLYLEVLAETGIVGFLAFLAVLYSVISGLNRARRIFKDVGSAHLLGWVSAVETSMVSFLVTSIFLHGAYVRYFWLLIAVALGGHAYATVLEQQSAKHADQSEFYVTRELIGI